MDVSLSATNVVALVLLIALLIIFFSISFEIRTTRGMENAARGCSMTGDNSAKYARDTMRGYYNWMVGRGGEEFVGSDGQGRRRQYDGEYT